MQLTHTHIQFCVVNPRGRLSQTPLLAHTHTYVKQGGWTGGCVSLCYCAYPPCKSERHQIIITRDEGTGDANREARKRPI
jgi:hypothetical protein